LCSTRRAGVTRTPRGDHGAGPDQEHLEFYVLNPDGTPNDGADADPALVRREGLYRPKTTIRREDGVVERALGGNAPTWRDAQGQALRRAPFITD
jgi:hypothetical protein